MHRRYAGLMTVLVVACAGLTVLAFLVGSSPISWAEFVELVQGNASDTVRNVFLQLRLPRAIGALLVGCALSVSGCALQSVFRNPMADPYVLGISAGAGLGAALAMALLPQGGQAAVAGTGFVFAIGTIILVYNTARIAGKVSSYSLLLSGFVISALMSALLSLVMILNRDKMEQVVMWNLGSLSAMSWERIWVLLPVCTAGTVLLGLYGGPLNVMLTGEESAEALGVDTQRTRRVILGSASLLCAAAVSVSGVIGFVGLMVPHLLRLASSPDNRILIPLCAAGGGAYLLACDIAARTVVPSRELPVGIVTAILGVPFFVFLLRRSRGGRT